MVLKKKVLALVLVGAMVCGSSITAFATETGVSTATGTGTNTGHLDTNVVTAILPTSESIAGFFNFTIDPEDILATADKFTDNSTAAGTDFKNTDLVYFKQATGAAKPYASTSQAVPVKAKNYVAADVTVKATIGAAAEGKTIIPMAESEEAYTNATEPTLLLTLSVGDEDGIITDKGGEVTATIAEQSANFKTKIKVEDGEVKGYVVEPDSTVTDANWAGKDVKLTGKVKKGTVAEDIVAPNVTLTWTVAAHVDAPAPSASMSTSVKSVTINNLPSGVTLKSAKVVKKDNSEVALTATTQYTYTAATNTFAIVTGKEVLLNAATYSKFVLTYSDDSTVDIPIVAAP